jgi:hypothetical protein
VGIDRPDEDDAPEPRHDSPAPPPDTPNGDRDVPTAGPGGGPGADHGADPEADRAAYAMEYRARVAAEYGISDNPWTAHRTAWDEALPTLREAWTAHECQYPYPERSRPTLEPDGSWHSANLELTPKRNAEVDHDCERIREVGETVITPGMRAVEADDGSRCLVGFDHRFKGADRIKEKVAQELRYIPDMTTAQAMEMVPDAVRFTFQYDERSYTAGMRKDVERLEARGFIPVEHRDTWTSEQYKGINSRWQEPESGLVFEVQFHTRISYEAKQLTHQAYERIRSGAADPELAELKEFQGRVCAMIPIPPGARTRELPTGERDG